MKRLFLLLILISLFNNAALSAKPRAEQLELRIDNLKEQVDSLELLIETYEESQDIALLKVIFREQKILLSKLIKNYQKYKVLSKTQLGMHIKETKDLLKQARINYLSTLKLSKNGSLTGFDANPSYWDVYYSLQEDLDLLNTAIDQIEFSEILGTDDSGVYGKVSLISGDCMPGDMKVHGNCVTSFVARDLVVHKATLASDMNSGVEPEFTINSNDDGSFYISLQPGLYSIFAIEDGKEYCNSFDADGYACLVEVGAEQHTEFDIKIDKASH